MLFRTLSRFGKLVVDKFITVTGDTYATNIKVLMKDGSGNALFCVGTATAPTTGAGYAKGCVYIKTDVAAGTGAFYINKGSTTAASFTLATQA